MNNNVGFLLKVLAVSVGLSIAIKFGAPGLTIAPTTSNAIVAILLPTLVMSILLGWRATRQ